MNKINYKKEIIIWAALLAPFIYAMFIWSQVPDKVPIHFNMQGEADDYSGKTFGLLVFPAFNILIYFALFFLPRIDPRKKNYSLFGSSYENIRITIHVFFLIIYIYIIRQSIETGTGLQNFFPSLFFLFFAILGNYMRTVRSNFFIGIRTPWTLSDDRVWKKTHELGGRLWFYAGLAASCIALFLPQKAAFIFMMVVLTVIALIPVVASYFVYRKLHANTGE